MSSSQKALVFFSLFFCFLFYGCQKTPPSTTSQMQIQPELPSESSSPQSAPSDIAAPGAWSTFEWTNGGGLAIRRREQIDFTDRLGALVYTFAPRFDAWPLAPGEQLWGESFCDYANNGKYVLAWFHFFGNPAVMLLDGKPTIADAAILNMDGEPVRVFPSGASLGMTNISDNQSFEMSLARRTHFYWLGDDVLAISTGAEIWLYSIAQDELRLAADYRADVFNGWTMMESHGYGAVEGSAWVKGGSLYYAVNHGYTTDDTHNPISSLWRARWGEDPFCLVGDDTFTSFYMPNGYPLAVLSGYRLEPDGSRSPMCRIWYVDELSGSIFYLGMSNQYVSPVARQDLVSWTNYEPTSLSYLHVLQTINYYDLRTGDQTSFAPRADNGGFPNGVRLIDLFEVLDVSRTNDGYLIYYYFIDVTSERRAPADFVIYLACHNTATGKTSFSQLHTDNINPRPGDGPADVFLAIEQESRSLAILPFVPAA